MGIAGGYLTGHEMASKMGQALGEEVGYQDVPPAAYRGFGSPGAEDLGDMFQYYQEFEEEFCAACPVDRTRQLNPRLLSFDAWLAKYADRIPIEAPAS